MPTFQDKMTKLKALVDDFNSQSEKEIDFEGVQGKLMQAGAFDDATLSLLTEAELKDAGLPTLLARKAVTIVTANETTEGKPYISEKKAAQLTVQQLVEVFDPRDPDNAVAKRLSEMSKFQPCVVYSDESSATVAVTETVANVNAIRDGYPARDFVTYKGQPTKCYKVGERPFDMADENPLFVGQPLLPPDQICTVTNRSWAKAPLKVRQLMRLACQSGEFRNNTENAHNVLDAVQEGENDKLFERWSQRYPRAAIKFKELEQQGTLPTLKIPRGGYAGGGYTGPQDPFLPGHRRT
jgi:hypothetical protein